jgi:hypothetical protein
VRPFAGALAETAGSADGNEIEGTPVYLLRKELRKRLIAIAKAEFYMTSEGR